MELGVRSYGVKKLLKRQEFSCLFAENGWCEIGN